MTSSVAFLLFDFVIDFFGVARIIGSVISKVGFCLLRDGVARTVIIDGS